MKRLILSILVIMTLAVTVHADPIATINSDPVRFCEKSYIIWDSTGKEVGAIRVDYLNPGEYRILDNSGEQVGRIKKDAIRESAYILENSE